MNTLKKLTALLLCLAMVFTLAACSEEEPEDNSAELEAIEETLAKGDDDCKHTWGKWDEMVEASCTNAGIEVRTCENCGKQESQTLPAFGHDFDDGRCSDCDKKEKKCEHDDTEEVIIKAPTCTEKGKMHEICEECKAVVDDERLPALGHNYVYRDYQDATCTEEGWYGHEICENCGDGYVEYIAPYGHYFAGGVCEKCQAVDEDFTTVTADGVVENEIEISHTAGETYTAVGADIQTLSSAITYEDEVQYYEITAAVNGVYRIWFTEIYSGNSLNLYVYDSLGNEVGYSTWCGNNEGVTVTLTAGEVYEVEVKQRSGLPTYNINVGMQKEIVDITSYDMVIDSIDFLDQELYYSFTPAETGLYYFGLSEMQSGFNVNLYLYNYLGEQIYYSTWCGTGEGLTATELNAGETYTLCVTERDEFGPFHLSIGKQNPTEDVTGYNVISDAITYVDQINKYSFVADSNYVNFVLSDMEGGACVYLRLYNRLGEQIRYASWCYNGNGLMISDLTVGETYTIYVEQYSMFPTYKLHMYTPKPAVDITDGMGINDTIEYNNQTNLYNLKVSEDGTYYVRILENTAATGGDALYDCSVVVEIYDADGNYINGSYMYGADYMRTDLVSGMEYTVQVRYNYGKPAYMLCVE